MIIINLNGTFEHPFKIELELIKRNFYLDEVMAKNQYYQYNKKINILKLEKLKNIKDNIYLLTFIKYFFYLGITLRIGPNPNPHS